MRPAESNANYEHTWWTPRRWDKWIGDTIGTDYCDPCPVNWSSGDTCGLTTNWGRRFYCNHPGTRRGSTIPWWRKFVAEIEKPGHSHGIWCAFNIEQLRHMHPSPFNMDGWLIMPRKRIKFIWGGPDSDTQTHGQPGKSPGNWTIFWSSSIPAKPPDESIIVRTTMEWRV